MGTKTYRKIQRSNTEGRVEFSWAIGSYRERGDRCAQLCSEGFSCLSDILPSSPCFFLSPHSVCVPEAQQDGQHLSPSYVRSLLSLSLLPPSHLCSSLLSGTELSHIFFLIPFFFFFLIWLLSILSLVTFQKHGILTILFGKICNKNIEITPLRWGNTMFIPGLKCTLFISVI